MSRKLKRKRKADQKGKLIFCIAGLAIGLLAYFVFYIADPVIGRDKSSLCRVDGFVAKETAFVIDATDSFSVTQALIIKKEIEKVLDRSLVDERITLYVLGENVTSDVAKFSVCNPGDGADKSELTSNKRRLKAKWETGFYHRVVDAIDELIGNHKASQSPILEMIKFVSVNTMYDSLAEDKQILLVSDMLHHTKEYSHYRQKADYQAFFDTPYALEQKPYLSGVDVSILYVVRPNNMQRQNRGHIKFWELFVSNSGGFVSRVKSIN